MVQVATRYVYFFDEAQALPKGSSIRELLGGKGAGLAEMSAAGLPVPAGFTITTEACLRFYDAGRTFPAGLREQVAEAMRRLEERTGKVFGSEENPLLVSVRSGARVSMPGMMDTILNLGLNDRSVAGLARLTHNERFAWDAYRRFIMMFSNVVLGIGKEHFEALIEALRASRDLRTDAEIDAAAWRDLVGRFKAIVKERTGEEFPQDVHRQLRAAIEAVFDSWNSKRAVDYRRFNRIPDDWGTAVTVMEMVFGNMGDDSGTGVAFTRNPNTGEKSLFGEYLSNAQGEDVVAGIRTPEKISDLARRQPAVYAQFQEIAQRLERHYRDVQDLEFTVERGKLFMLQTRSAKRTAEAAVKIALDLVSEGLIDRRRAVAMVNAQSLDQLFHARIDPTQEMGVVCKGLNASPGAATGKIVFSAEDAVTWKERGEKTILVRTETTPDDVHGMIAAEGILTAKGGATSHAAVVARGMGKPCVAGCEALRIDRSNGRASFDGKELS
ncbi:MAG: pyruvate, phosphate dikinase, partial [Candidatus Eremiobacteraeota bacterium]|nr:pyruvate, phosphate dikinase [Candidatus Eremiobacteraeota bacterium]